MRIARASVRRPIGTSIIYLTIIVLGIVCLRELPVDLFPATDFPRITVVTPYPGVAPEEIETLITRPVERAVSTIEGIEDIEAYSSEGLSRVELHFAWGHDLQEALGDVRTQVDRLRTVLPEDAESPTIYKFDLASVPIAFLGIQGTGDPRRLKHLTEETLSRRLEGVAGIASVAVRGGRDREIRVELTAERLSALAVSATEVSQALARENRTLSGGDMMDSGTEVVIRTAGEFESVADIEEVVVATRDGQPIRVRDVGRVVDGFREPRSEMWIDGEPGIRVMVFKRSGANTVEVVEALRAEIDAINRDYHGRVELEVLYDSSDFIKASVINVQDSLLIGSCLALLVLLLFLRDVRAALVVAVSVPISIIATFAVMYLAGISLNIVSFGGLALGIGMLVDCSIVILENIFRRREAGDDPDVAAIEGSREVGPAIISGTLTTMVVFVPVVFIAGFAGVFFGEMALVVTFSQIASLLAALTLVPMLAARLLRKERQKGPGRGVIAGLRAWSDRLLDRIDVGYSKVVGAAIRQPWAVVVLAVGMLAASVVLVDKVGMELLPETDEGRLDVDVDLPVGTPLETTMETMLDLEGRIRSVLREGELRHIVTNAGPDAWWQPGGSNQGEVTLMLVPVSQRERGIADIEADVRRAVAGVPGADAVVRRSSSNMMTRIIRGGDDRLAVEVRGHDLLTADALAARVMAAMRGIDGITHTRPDRELGQLERELVVDRGRAAELGLGSGDVATAVEHYVLGRVATRLRDDGDEFDVRVRLRDDDRELLDRLPSLPVVTRDGRHVPLAALVQVHERQGASSIFRKNQGRVLTIDAGVGNRPLGAIVADLERALHGIEVPDGFSLKVAGEHVEQQENFGGLLIGILLAIFLVYAVMAIQFESLRHPLVVMVSVPFGFIGVVLTLLATDTTFNMNSFLGAIVLVGVVVNNAIVLVDYTNLLREEHGLDLDAALVEAARTRLRPILMTTLATVLGLIPVALGVGEGSEIQAPLGRVLAGGLTAGTLVTLVLVPCLYKLVEPRRARAAVPSAAPEPEPAPGE